VSVFQVSDKVWNSAKQNKTKKRKIHICVQTLWHYHVILQVQHSYPSSTHFSSLNPRAIIFLWLVFIFTVYSTNYYISHPHPLHFWTTTFFTYHSLPVPDLPPNQLGTTSLIFHLFFSLLFCFCFRCIYHCFGHCPFRIFYTTVDYTLKSFFLYSLFLFLLYLFLSGSTVFSFFIAFFY